MLLFGVKSFEYSFFCNLYNSVSWRYCLLLYHFTDKKTKVEGVKLLAKGRESSGAGIPSEVSPTPESESFKHYAIW